MSFNSTESLLLPKIVATCPAIYICLWDLKTLCEDYYLDVLSHCAQNS